MKKANQVLIIQISTQGRRWIEGILEPNRIEGRDYLFFDRYDQDFLDRIEAKLPQLIFTSHATGCDAELVSEDVKRKNPQAIVCALTSSRVSDDTARKLDGALDRFELPEEALGEIIDYFLSVPEREEVIDFIQKYS